MKFTTKTTLIFFGFSFLVVLSSLIAQFQFAQVTKELREELPESIEELSLNSRLDNLAKLIKYYDEVLTQSARNYAFTGDVWWKQRYHSVEPELDKAIKEAITNGDEIDVNIFNTIDRANLALVEMEIDSIKHVDVGNYEEAKSILEDNFYWQQKRIYEQGLRDYFEKRGLAYDRSLETSTLAVKLESQRVGEQIALSSAFTLGIILFLLFLGIIFAYFFSTVVTRPINQLARAAQSMSKGDYSKRVSIPTEDELAELAQQFNNAAEQLQRLHKEQKRLEKAKTEFLSITSHELRSPMTPMRAQLQMLLADYFGKTTDKQRGALDIILRNTERLDKIIQDLLEISRIEAARIKFEFKQVQLEEHITRLVEEMNSYIPEKKITIKTNIEKLPLITTDPQRVMQVLRNLIDNAKKFSPPNSTITLTAKKEDESIILSVKDQGIGINQKNLEKLFTPFFQAEKTMYRKYGGTGLGLAICRGIVQTQGGTIWAESKQGKGTTFYFTLPLKPIQKIKPISLMFTPTTELEQQLKRSLIEQLGPMGIHEFNLLQKQGITEENIQRYLTNLSRKNVITLETFENIQKDLEPVLGKLPQEQTRKNLLKTNKNKNRGKDT